MDLDRPGTVTVRVTNENDPARLLQVVADYERLSAVQTLVTQVTGERQGRDILA